MAADEIAAVDKRRPFVKVDGFEPCVQCGRPTCFTLRGVRIHRACAVLSDEGSS